jgi:maltose alpha-D-glucosyltransferase/alpha-amylase
MIKWIKDACFYQIYPSSFKDSNNDGYGDINGICEKIPYLLDLGINALWINPMYKSPFMDGGYDVEDYFKIDKRFGTMQDFEKLVRLCHKNAIKLVMDLVPGHTSEKNALFLKSAKQKPSPYQDMFIWTDSWWEAPSEYKLVSGRYERDGNYLVNFFSTQPALNYGFNQTSSPWQISYLDPRVEVTFNYLLKIIEFWIKKGVDGFRVDMADSLVKNDPQKKATCELWRKVFSIVRPKYPDVAFISEWSSVDAINKATFDVDFMLNHYWNPYNRLLRFENTGYGQSIFNKEGKGNVETYIREYLNWYNQIKGKGLIANITCNHDFERLRPQYSYLQCKLIIAYLLCLPGVPFIYYGDEIGMKYVSNLASIEGGYSRTGTRCPMKWDQSQYYGFSNTKPFIVQSKNDSCVALELKNKNTLLNTIKEVINIRKNSDDLKSDDLEFLSNKLPLIVKRKDSVVVVNPTSKPKNLDFDFSNYKIIFKIGKYNRSLIGALSLVIFKLNQ